MIDKYSSDISKDNCPVVSVIMPCYNHEGYVEHAVKSVIDQTYPNVELIVVNDGSTDNSLGILENLLKSYKFTLVNQENMGVCKALNRGISEFAHGEYFALLASDDFWHLDKLRQQVAQLQLHVESEFCFSQAIKFSNDCDLNSGKVFPRKCISGHVLNEVFIHQHVPAGTMLFSRQLYERLGGFDETLKEEDWDFVIRCAAVTPFVSVNAPLLYYRSHQGNTMKTRNRSAIFHQKAKILSKNFELVTPWRWLLAICIHFLHDIVFRRFFIK